MKTLIHSLISSFLLLMTAEGSMGSPSVLDIETYRSPSTKWELEVDPSNRAGSGKGSYKMVAEGKEVWSGELPFTLHDAQVTDAGLTVGYGYSHGEDGNGEGAPGTLNLVILDSAGKVRLNDAVKRSDPRVPDTLPGPLASGLVVHPEADRLIVSVVSNWKESWRVYELSTGKRLDVFDLKTASGVGDAARFIIAAEPVPGRQLTLVQWWRYDDEGNAGAVFALLDFKGRKVWSLELPEDYEIPGDEKVEDKLRNEIRRTGAILPMGEPGSFEIRTVATGERVRYQVTRGTGKTAWTVAETSRTKYAPPLPPSEPKPVTEAEAPPLRLLGSFLLKDQAVGGPIRNIDAFAIDGSGRFGFLRRGDPGKTTFVLVDQQSNLVAEVPLPVLTKETDYHFAWLKGSQWVITASDLGVGGKSRGWVLDVETKFLTAINGFKCDAIDALQGTGDGGFVALASRKQEFSSVEYLVCFDSLGDERWRHEAKSGDEPSALFSPKDFTVTSRKEIAVLDVVRHTVQVYTLEGAYLRTIDLEKAWKRAPNYPSEITADTDGGFIVGDFNGKVPFVRMKADGSVRGDLKPKRVDGRVIHADTGLRTTPDGSLWACDGDSFVKLSDQGTEIGVIGSAADPDKLGGIAAVGGDTHGNTYAVDDRTGSVHVFGPDGSKLRVCKPAINDLTSRMRDAHLAITGDGGVMLMSEKETRGRVEYVCFGPDGVRQGIRSLEIDDVGEKWYPQPGTANILVAGYRTVSLVDAEGKVLKKIERQPDRKWLGTSPEVACADDGSFAIESREGYGENRKQTISFFTAAGEPAGMCRIESEGWMMGGYNGRVFSMATDAGVRIYDRSGKLIGGTSKRWPGHFITQGGKELWVVNDAERKVERYELP